MSKQKESVILQPPYRHAHTSNMKYNACFYKEIMTNPNSICTMEDIVPYLDEELMAEYYYKILSQQLNYRDKSNMFYSITYGHRWAYPGTGLIPSSVMCVVDKLLPEDVANNNTILSGNMFQAVWEHLRKYGIDASEFYISTIYKANNQSVIDGIVNLSQTMRSDWYPVLDMELGIVNPSYLLLMGAEAVKWWFGNQHKLTDIEGSCFDDSYVAYKQCNSCEEVAMGGSDNCRMYNLKVIPMCHPKVSVLAKTEKDASRMLIGLNTFLNVVHESKSTETVTHFVVNTIEAVRSLRDTINRDCVDNLIAIDAEWNGDHPVNKDWYLRTLQISWAPKTAAAIVLHDVNGNCIYTKEEEAEVKQCICDILKNKQIAGHYVDADMEHLIAYGIPILDYFFIPDSHEAYQELVTNDKACGFDTALAAHAIEETDDFSLTSQYLKHTTAPRYELDLQAFLKDYKANKNNPELSGYGPVPDSILCPYGNYDADVTRRIAVILKKQLLSDRFGHNCFLPFWANMRVLPAVLAIKMNGIAVDMDLLNTMTQLYMDTYTVMLKRLQKFVGYNFQSFKFGSIKHKKYFLFGMGDKPDEGALTISAIPLFSTGKQAVPWEEIVNTGRTSTANPSTDKKTLRLLINSMGDSTYDGYDENNQHVLLSRQEAIQLFLDCQTIQTVLRGVLRPPINSDITEDDSDNATVKYEKGLPKYICDDGRIHTTLYTTKETGRWSSARPNLQNIGKTAEDMYKRILGDTYIAPLRALFKADPGYLLVSSDFIGAELTAIATLSGDQTMLDHVSRSQLDENDPNFYDIHSHVAVFAFKLNCKPTKSDLKKSGLGHYRILAKSVIFGTLYGRGARAIAKQAEAEGMSTTVDDAQKVIDTIFKMYPKLKQFLRSCTSAAISPGWLCNSFGRYRRFGKPTDSKVAAEFGRQAQNYPVQSLVADAVTRVVSNLYYRKEEFNVDYKLVLQVHDEVNALVAINDVERYVKEILPECMIRSVPIYPRHVDGTLTGTGPYYFGNDVTVCEHWGMPIGKEELQKIYKIKL